MRIPANFDFAAARRHAHRHVLPRDLSRRQFLGASAVATGAAVTSGLWLPMLAHADDEATVLPQPIAGNPSLGGFHIQLPASGTDGSAITDFKGRIGVAHISGTGTASDGVSSVYDADMRFMQGEYVGVDGHRHEGTFGFI
jgi:hypothetical protein